MIYGFDARVGPGVLRLLWIYLMLVVLYSGWREDARGRLVWTLIKSVSPILRLNARAEPGDSLRLLLVLRSPEGVNLE